MKNLENLFINFMFRMFQWKIRKKLVYKLPDQKFTMKNWKKKHVDKLSEKW